VLQGWNQCLQFHPHVHCVLAACGLAPDQSRWISARHSFSLPIGVLSRVFRRKFVAGLRTPSSVGSFSSAATYCLWPSRAPSLPGCGCCSGTTGSRTPSVPLSSVLGRRRGTRRACFGIRVDAAIHRMAFGKRERPKRARLLPALVTMERERQVARLIPRLSWA
jgi:hypothetical protein